ncbi:MAG: hypothetical protein ACXABD_04450 [Candidatus Thorarchaeota archaeon]|jgi:hypothetical protein
MLSFVLRKNAKIEELANKSSDEGLDAIKAEIKESSSFKRDSDHLYPTYAGYLTAYFRQAVELLKGNQKELVETTARKEALEWAIELFTDKVNVDSWDFKCTVMDTVYRAADMIEQALLHGITDERLRKHFDKGSKNNENELPISDEEFEDGVLHINEQIPVATYE